MKPAPKGVFDDSIRIDALLNNQIVNRARELAGAFDYGDLDPSSLKLPPGTQLTKKGPFKLVQGPVYQGEWMSDLSQRTGVGMQVWQDGSVYEGQWSYNKANGVGRLVHADGDIYEGEWVNDKAHGNGIFRGIDGAVYTGQWLEDV